MASWNPEMAILLQAIRSHPGFNAKELSTVLDGRPYDTITKQLNKLIKLKLVHRTGGRRFGGYYQL